MSERDRDCWLSKLDSFSNTYLALWAKRTKGLGCRTTCRKFFNSMLSSFNKRQCVLELLLFKFLSVRVSWKNQWVIKKNCCVIVITILHCVLRVWNRGSCALFMSQSSPLCCTRKILATMRKTFQAVRV